MWNEEENCGSLVNAFLTPFIPDLKSHNLTHDMCIFMELRLEKVQAAP